MHFLRVVSALAFGVLFLGVSSSALAAGGGDHENVGATHADDAVVTERQPEAPPIGAPRDPNPRRDPTMFGWGVVMTITGGLAMISGLAVAMTEMGDSLCIKWSDGDCPNRAAATRVVDTGMAIASAGMVLLGVGIPLAIVGGRHVKSRAAPVTAAIVPIVGPGRAGSAFALTF